MAATDATLSLRVRARLINLFVLSLLILVAGGCNLSPAPSPPSPPPEPGIPGDWYYDLQSGDTLPEIIGYDPEPAALIEYKSGSRGFAVYARARDLYSGVEHRTLVEVMPLDFALNFTDDYVYHSLGGPWLENLPLNTTALEIYVYRAADGKRYRYDYDFRWEESPKGYLVPKIAYRSGSEIPAFPDGMVEPWKDAEALKHATIPQALPVAVCSQVDWPGRMASRPARGGWFLAEQRAVQTGWHQYWWNAPDLKNGGDGSQLTLATYSTSVNNWQIGAGLSFPSWNTLSDYIPAFGPLRLVYFFVDYYNPDDAAAFGDNYPKVPSPFHDTYWRYFAELEVSENPDGSVACGPAKWGVEQVTDPDEVALLEQWRTDPNSQPMPGDPLPAQLLPTPWR